MVPFQPCLTVRLESQMKDYPIHTVQIGNTRMFTIDGVNKASTVVGIVQKHYQEKISLQDDGVLLKPIPKQPWELSKDKIQLKTKLGEGAFGEVWKGTLRQSPTKTVEAAIKVTKLKEDNKKYMQEMYKEARLMRQYQHMQAPEVVATHIYTRECDVYSYGILVWEIFNNAKMPFAEYDNKTVRARIFDPTFRPPLSDDLPDEIRVIVTACWAAQPNNRPVMKDVAWILKRFQKHNVPEQAIRKPAPPAPAAKPMPAEPPPAVAPPAIIAPVVIAKTTKIIPKDRRMASKPATPQAKPVAPPSRKGFPDPRKVYIEMEVESAASKRKSRRASTVKAGEKKKSSTPKRKNREQEYEVEAIISHSVVDGVVVYQVTWVGYPGEVTDLLEEDLILEIRFSPSCTFYVTVS
ncbi:hypothetical protein Aduo_012449 [Ancylostoma duodenale]